MYVNKYDELFKRRRELFKWPELHYSAIILGDENPQIISAVPATLAPENWGQQEDRDILMGVVKYGYQGI